MTVTRELWTAVGEQARLWGDTPTASAVSSQLPRNAPQRATGVPGLLQELHAGFGSMMTQPLRHGSTVPPLMTVGMMPGRAASPEHELNLWLDLARRLEMAHRSTVAWFRSRLPSYPLLLAPQLVPGTPLTTSQWTNRLIWAADERHRGLQYQGSPPDVGSALDAQGIAARDLSESARVVATALERTDEWASFQQAVEALGQEGKADLRSARSRLAELLTAAAIDAHEPDLAVPRGEYRAHVTMNVVDSLAGPSRSYADAFAAANDLIETSASEVFGQLAMHGEPISLPTTDLDFLGGEPTKVNFEIDDAYVTVVQCGNLAWIDDPMVSDAVRVESISMRLDPAVRTGLKIGASILDNTGGAWA